MYLFNLAFLLLPRADSDKSLLERYGDVFASPLFQIMLLIALIILYFGYQYFIVKDQRLTEEESYLNEQLRYYGLQFLSSSLQQEKGPFAKTETKADIFSKIQPVFAYHLVKAKNQEGQEIELWAKVEYKASALSSISWIPNIETMG